MGAGVWVVNAASLNHKLPARWLLYEMENSPQIKKITQNKKIYMYIPLAGRSAEENSGSPMAKCKNMKTHLNRHLNREKRENAFLLASGKENKSVHFNEN